MPAISLRLPEDLEDRLTREASLANRPRSEVIRDALADFLTRRERERFMAEMVSEVRQGYADPDTRRDALEIADEAPDDGIESILAEERDAGIDPAEKWWR